MNSVILCNIENMLTTRGLKIIYKSLTKSEVDTVCCLIAAIPKDFVKNVTLSWDSKRDILVKANVPTLIYWCNFDYNSRDHNKLLKKCQKNTSPILEKCLQTVKVHGIHNFDRIIIIVRRTKHQIVDIKKNHKHTTAIIYNKQRLDIFSSAYFKFNILKHVLVPKHIVLSMKELRDITIKYGHGEIPPSMNDISDFISKMPSISVYDPVVRILGGISPINKSNLCTGTVFKIQRNNNDDISYRKVKHDLGL